MNVTSPTDQVVTSHWWTMAEVIVTMTLVGLWSIAYIDVADEIEALADFRRSRTLTLYGTYSRIWLGYALGLVSIAVVLLQRFAPLRVFMTGASLAAAAGWWFSYLATESVAIEAAVVVGAFWAVLHTGRWRLIVVCAVGSMIGGNLRAYQLNSRLDALGGDTSGWIGPTVQLVLLAMFVGVAVGAATLARRSWVI